MAFRKLASRLRPGTRHQPCWVHKTANVLNTVALSVQANMKKDLRKIYLAPSRALAEVAINVFAEKYQAKHHKAVDCLTKDREGLPAFFDFPAESHHHQADRALLEHGRPERGCGRCGGQTPRRARQPQHRDLPRHAREWTWSTWNTR